MYISQFHRRKSGTIRNGPLVLTGGKPVEFYPKLRFYYSAKMLEALNMRQKGTQKILQQKIPVYKGGGGGVNNGHCLDRVVLPLSPPLPTHYIIPRTT